MDRDDRKAVRLRRSDTDIRVVKRTARLVLAEFCPCAAEKDHLATASQIRALCDRLDAADGGDFETGAIVERGAE